MILTEVTRTSSSTTKSQPSSAQPPPVQAENQQEPTLTPSSDAKKRKQAEEALRLKNKDFQVQKIEREIDFSLLKRAFYKNAQKIESFVKKNLNQMVSSLCLSGKTQKKSLAEGRHICDLKVRFFHGEVQVLVKSRLGIGAFKTIEKVAHLAGPFLPHQPGPIYAYAKIIERKELRQELKKIEAELSEATASTATLTQIAELRQEKAELRAEIESVQNALHEEAAISKEFPNSDIVRMWTVTNQKDPSSIKGVMMELCDCGDISTFVDALSFPLSPDAMRRNVRLAFHIAKALADIHAQGRGRCHLDIKPGNILLKYENGKIVPKLTDFGLSKCTGAFLKQPCGTPAYIAPELYGNAKTAQPSMDAWSFGIICTELFYGLSANPFLQNDEVLSAAQDFFNHARYRRNKALWEHLGEEIKASVRQYPAIDTVIRHLLDLNPLTRWTAQKAADAFSQLLNKLG